MQRWICAVVALIGLGCAGDAAPARAPAYPSSRPRSAADVAAEARLRREWGRPVEPFRLVGDLYYVGAANIAAYLFVTSRGLVLVDAGTREMGPTVRANIEQLGLRPDDVEILLVSHAHWDHVEGLAAMKRATGARLMAMAAEVPALTSGEDRSALGDIGWEPVAVDRVLVDGDQVRLGELTLTARWTPGHTQGCTTWTTEIRDGDRRYQVVLAGVPAANAGVRLLGNRRHPTIAADLARSLRMLRGLQPDIFLTAHPADLLRGVEARVRAGEAPSPLVNPAAYRAFLDEAQADLDARLRAERAAARARR